MAGGRRGRAFTGYVCCPGPFSILKSSERTPLLRLSNKSTAFAKHRSQKRRSSRRTDKTHFSAHRNAVNVRRRCLQFSLLHAAAKCWLYGIWAKRLHGLFIGGEWLRLPAN